ncbi:hypothetical protein [Ramlibacter rhizophilus]|uniref:DUF2946 domain-containing protein n=1 Tax=Ramlibacter rhizophilus TaxID=1781167 RepID=A0A4Z0BDL1_9BURK|nr:hypothetical protein [Ramlibacter rhizophilus]TFY96553.1 hypothetical protein EZ242_21260 [Ramlibacter rhizophilus]
MRLRLAWILGLALALLAAQAVGLAHRTVHGPQPAGAAHAAAQADHDGHDLFGHEAGGIDCRLLDALGQPGVPGAPSLVLPLALSPVVLAGGHGDFVARWVALFDARGPPARS